MEKTLRTLSEHRRILAQGRGGSEELEGGQGTLQGREGGGGQDAGAGPVAPGVVRTVGEYWGPCTVSFYMASCHNRSRSRVKITPLFLRHLSRPSGKNHCVSKGHFGKDKGIKQIIDG